MPLHDGDGVHGWREGGGRESSSNIEYATGPPDSLINRAKNKYAYNRATQILHKPRSHLQILGAKWRQESK